MENSYTSLAVAINNLQDEGFTVDFNLCAAGVENKQKGITYNASELKVLRYYRFEGMSNPEDNTILYVIEAANGDRGLLLDAYGVYAGNVPKEMIDKLRILR